MKRLGCFSFDERKGLRLARVLGMTLPIFFFFWGGGRVGLDPPAGQLKEFHPDLVAPGVISKTACDCDSHCQKVLASLKQDCFGN